MLLSIPSGKEVVARVEQWLKYGLELDMRICTRYSTLHYFQIATNLPFLNVCNASIVLEKKEREGNADALNSKQVNVP